MAESDLGPSPASGTSLRNPDGEPWPDGAGSGVDCSPPAAAATTTERTSEPGVGGGGGGALAPFAAASASAAAAAAAAAAALCAPLLRMRVRRRYTQSPGFLSHLLQGVWPLQRTFLRRHGSHALGFFSMPVAAAAAACPAARACWTSGAAVARASRTVTAHSVVGLPVPLEQGSGTRLSAGVDRCRRIRAAQPKTRHAGLGNRLIPRAFGPWRWSVETDQEALSGSRGNESELGGRIYVCFYRRF